MPDPRTLILDLELIVVSSFTVELDGAAGDLTGTRKQANNGSGGGRPPEPDSPNDCNSLTG